MITYTKIALSVILVIGVNSYAQADVIKLTDSASLQQQHGQQYFSQNGISGEKVFVVETAGADMSLSLAAKTIVPDSWVIKPSGNYENAVISWGGGVSWPIILRNIANDEGIYIHLDWIAKTVVINVPGQTESEQVLARDNDDSLKEKRQEFRKKQRQTWELRNDSAVKLASERKQFMEMANRQKQSQVANQKFISELNEQNELVRRSNDSLRKALEDERAKSDAMKEKYSVINPSTLKEEQKEDAAQLFVDYKAAWVLPFDPSFEYYIKGGHNDFIETYTPATYIAKSGDVQNVLEQWASIVGWHIDYRAGIQHKNPFEVEFKGSFIDASRSLVRIFAKSKRPINITFHPDVVVEMDDGTRKKGLAIITDLNYQKR